MAGTVVLAHRDYRNAGTVGPRSSLRISIVVALVAIGSAWARAAAIAQKWPRFAIVAPQPSEKFSEPPPKTELPR
eukprot:1767511-Pyramimonas_sp.AAC.1